MKEPMNINTAAEDARKIARERTRNAYQRLFSSDDGKSVLQDLKAAFDQSAHSGDAHTMVVSASRRMVIDYIQAAMKERNDV